MDSLRRGPFSEWWTQREVDRMVPDPERVQAVFLAALECQDPAKRAAVLDTQCSTDAELRGRVEALLRAHDQFDSSLDGPLATR
jgi:hypothetical protein